MVKPPSKAADAGSSFRHTVRLRHGSSSNRLPNPLLDFTAIRAILKRLTARGRTMFPGIASSRLHFGPLRTSACCAERQKCRSARAVSSIDRVFRARNRANGLRDTKSMCCAQTWLAQIGARNITRFAPI
jgi:hypothetical protein